MSKSLGLAQPWLGGIRSSLASRLAGQTTIRTPPGVVGIPSSAPRPIGGFRGAITGFALGLAATSIVGFVYLLRDYQAATEAMTVSTQELESSTRKITEAYARVTELEEQVKRLEQSAGTKEELRRRNGDLIRVYDALHEDVYEVRRKLYDIGECNDIQSNSLS